MLVSSARLRAMYSRPRSPQGISTPSPGPVCSQCVHDSSVSTLPGVSERVTKRDFEASELLLSASACTAMPRGTRLRATAARSRPSEQNRGRTVRPRSGHGAPISPAGRRRPRPARGWELRPALRSRDQWSSSDGGGPGSVDLEDHAARLGERPRRVRGQHVDTRQPEVRHLHRLRRVCDERGWRVMHREIVGQQRCHSQCSSP